MVCFSALVILSTIATTLATPVKRDVELERFVFRRNNSTDLSRRGNPTYNQDYVAGGDVIFTPSGAGTFEVQWDAPTAADDFVVGRGWSTGGVSPITFSGNFGAGSGTGLLSVYGWSTNPLVEYYVVEDSLNPPSFGTLKGSFTSDGSTYTVYENTRVNEPSIEGVSTFNQYISVRSSKRSSGTVTVDNHFNKWGSLGMSLGSLSYQVIAVEGWGGEGIATQTVSN
ncbi:glycoside hydrolase family 11 protein [Oidiodendron maius Zn]|uniref:Endo-1,4-beta-xylanase n=1 Tax=Oidiodendron maius (strain Zn) TaxID=913774 RepID=A0A0C3GX81_OIDMZ|nr:glycoside hydrolase family 11 protein [Oidiodendron maius Zn]